jgi:hypothetical protein
MGKLEGNWEVKENWEVKGEIRSEAYGILRGKGLMIS